jgi:hypothetical protein
MLNVDRGQLCGIGLERGRVLWILLSVGFEKKWIVSYLMSDAGFGKALRMDSSSRDS